MPQWLESLEGRVLLSAAPNDPEYPRQWALPAIGAPLAWEAGTGSAQVVVGHVDTGIDYRHPDLYLNVWINQGEISRLRRRRLVDVDGDRLITFYDLNDDANRGRAKDVNRNGRIDGGDLIASAARGGWADGKDDDGNGYADDFIGWDFAEGDNNPLDPLGHGTHTAGIIGAVGNNGIGIAGVAWKTSLMAVKIFHEFGDAVEDRKLAEAIRYSADNGARISNNSWGSEIYSRAHYNAIRYAARKGQLFVTAAGNDRANHESRFYESYPSDYGLKRIISVTATGPKGRLASYSNYGRFSVDLAAPGNGIRSTVRRGGYRTMTGTSMSAPHVTGALVLMLSAEPELTANEALARLIRGADQAPRLLGTSVSNGELNIGAALTDCAGERVGDRGLPLPFGRRDSRCAECLFSRVRIASVLE